jgi:hypothetical protein
MMREKYSIKQADIGPFQDADVAESTITSDCSVFDVRCYLLQAGLI